MTKSMVEKELIQNAQGIAVSISYKIMGNIEDYKSFIETIETKKVDDEYKYYQNEYYQKMQAFFANVKAYSNVKFIYTERRIDEKTTEFILDAEPAGSPDHSPPMSIEPNNPRKEVIYLNKQPAGYQLANYADWGTLLGATAPIFDTNGEMLGIVGIDIDSSHLHNYLRTMQMVLCIIYVIILGIALLILIKYSEIILDPLLKDKLTGAYNKRYLEKFLQSNIDTALKEHKNLTLLMVDLDHFKNINDTYGHTFGDKILSSASETIKSSLRQNDIFFRYGGEEFIIMIPDASEKQAMEIAERIRSTIESRETYNEEKNISVKMTISIGVAGLNLAALSAQEFINNADKALYVAKEVRNTIFLFKHDS